MSGRTVVLVSHHVQLTAPGVDYVVSLANGRVKFSGSSKEFLETGGYKNADEEEEPIETTIKTPAAKPKNKAVAELVTESTYVSETSSASEAEDSSDDEDDKEDKVAPVEKKARKLIEEESKAIGHVKWSVWRLYLGLSGGVFFWIIFTFSFGGAKLSDVAQTYWLNLWGESKARP